MTTDARTLADRLAAMDDAELAELLAARRVPPAATWSDFFDAAAALLDAAALDRVMARLSRPELEALTRAVNGEADASGSSELAELSSLALLTGEGEVYAEAAAALARALSAHPVTESTVAPTPPAPASPDEIAAAAERAFTSVAELADVLIACLHTPIGRIGSGAMSAADRRRLVESGAVREPEEAEALVALAQTSGLVRAVDRAWLVTETGVRWLDLATADRWAHVAERFRDDLPDALRTPARGWLPPATWTLAYPLDADWARRADALTVAATLWGLITPALSEPPWAEGLRRGEPADSASLTALLPHEVDRIYLQNDLTAIAPGPLAPALDLRLRTMAERESRAQASTYRFTADSIARAAAQGETAQSLRTFLTGLSLTGVPQPLEYLIERTTARHGLVRVAADPETGRTRVTSDDPHVIATIAVDQALRSLGLVRDGDDLTSRVTRDAVYWSFVDARYPVVAHDGSGIPEHPRRRRLAPEGSAPLSAAEQYARLIAALRSAHGTDADSAWLGRELDVAVRTRAVVVIMVALPDGSTREFTLEATGLGGGRLRGRDRGSDVERTLPVSSIVSVRAAG